MARVPAAERITLDSIRDLLGPAAVGATVEPSACEVMKELDPRLVSAVGRALHEADAEVRIHRVFGYRDVEDLEWHQLVLDVSGAKSGSDRWRKVIEASGLAIRGAAKLEPDFDHQLSQIGFHF